MMNSIIENLRKWDRDHSWLEDGDEWKGQALACNVSYEHWKTVLVENLILPYATGKTVLEIAPGHGRWSEYLIAASAKTIIVDLSPSCIEYCRQRFFNKENVEYVVNDGMHLPDMLTNQVDFVWSYDSFVHMEPTVIIAYINEIARILKTGGRAIIHHAGRRHLWLAFMRNYGNASCQVFRWISQGIKLDNDGWRSNVSKELVAKFVRDAGLSVEKQINRWGDGSIGIPRYNDYITFIYR